MQQVYDKTITRACNYIVLKEFIKTQFPKNLDFKKKKKKADNLLPEPPLNGMRANVAANELN